MSIEKHVKENFSILQVIGVLIGTAVTLTAFAFGTFQTKIDFREFMDMFEKRIDRLELKIDEVLKQTK